MASAIVVCGNDRINHGDDNKPQQVSVYASAEYVNLGHEPRCRWDAGK